MAENPEHQKLASIHAESQTIGKFLEWLIGQADLDICEYREPHDVWIPTRKSVEQLLADYFEIDLERLEAEKSAMLDTIWESVVAEKDPRP